MALFTLDPRLAADTHLLGRISLTDDLPCQVRLLDDVRYSWLVLVPEQPECTEAFDLPAAGWLSLMEYTARWSRILKQHHGADKINIGALGNVVSQLHLHLVVRHRTDPAWPGPVWGHSTAVPYTPTQLAEQKNIMCRLLIPDNQTT
ncbi:HIT family protein [Larsenimonas rhizosphaerae]|uniref:HIT family protein n=1 Tax=Larsenimonas rhizosphaerae TaxID=2944682 RepID=A0AA41ZH65_9GAMM|nr:HIT family protein [Larsenimonas rhizosphaerae]MCM2129825.1 HIT family protein [Larsenimonas rhizosphaerae]MCX2524485.1 HIT family protein [Larsenimonas rhizosphaerae]